MIWNYTLDHKAFLLGCVLQVLAFINCSKSSLLNSLFRVTYIFWRRLIENIYVPTLTAQRKQTKKIFYMRAIKNIAETILATTGENVFLQAFGKVWESWTRAVLIPQNWCIALRKPAQLSVLQSASLQQRCGTVCLPSGLGKQEDIALVTQTHGTSGAVFTTEDCWFSWRSFFRMEKNLLEGQSSHPPNKQSVGLIKILLVPTRLVYKAFLRSLDRGDEQNSISGG